MSLKEGRKYFYITKNYDKHISFEWSFRPLDIFNFNLKIDGREGEYVFSFWLIFVFYISTNIFNKYPREWNSYSNNRHGGYLNSAIRKIGISQYNDWITMYIWHSGDASWYPRKDKQYFYYSITLKSIFIGEHNYISNNNIYVDTHIKLREGLQKINYETYTQIKTYKRFYMKPFQKTTHHIFFFSDIKIPRQHIQVSSIDMYENEKEMYLDNELKMDRVHYSREEWVGSKIYIDKYIKHINDLRDKYYTEWVPYEYRKQYLRFKKMKNILKD